MSSFRKSDPHAPPNFFATEAWGLEWLRDAHAVAVPRVIGVGPDHIELERIERGPWTDAVDERFGRELAQLHQAGAPSFGGDRPAFIGPLSMPNEPSPSWPSFYAAQRLLPFVDRVPAELRAAVDRVVARIDDLAGPPESPARIHGDLWTGKAMADPAGAPWLIDPATHGGHRETDLAMMRLFGGFGARCFDAYDEIHRPADGWRDRIPLHQLHPLLVHVVLFGGSYVRQAIDAARCYA